MAERTPSLEELIRGLPDDLQQEVRDFAEFLLHKRQRPAAGKITRSWRGVLRDMGEENNSVELKHKITHEWRDEDLA